LHEIWHRESPPGRNQLCQIFWQSVHGSPFCRGSNFALVHWLRLSPLIQCCATARLWLLYSISTLWLLAIQMNFQLLGKNVTSTRTTMPIRLVSDVKGNICRMVKCKRRESGVRNVMEFRSRFSNVRPTLSVHVTRATYHTTSNTTKTFLTGIIYRKVTQARFLSSPGFSAQLRQRPLVNAYEFMTH